MTLTEKIIFGAVVVAVSLVGSYFLFFRGASLPSFGATSSVGNLLAEHYLPYVATNLGYNTALGIKNTGTEQVGTNGTVFSSENTGVCFIQPYATTIAASSTALVDCQGTAAVGTTNTGKDTALPGIVQGGFSEGTLGTTTASQNGSSISAFGGLILLGVSASTTPGYLQLLLLNQFGTTFTWPLVGTASGSMKYFDFH